METEWQLQRPPGGVGRGSVERRWNGGAARGWLLGVECRAVCLPVCVFRRFGNWKRTKNARKGANGKRACRGVQMTPPLTYQHSGAAPKYESTRWAEMWPPNSINFVKVWPDAASDHLVRSRLANRHANHNVFVLGPTKCYTHQRKFANKPLADESMNAPTTCH
jgi:hypothetical protein